MDPYDQHADPTPSVRSDDASAPHEPLPPGRVAPDPGTPLSRTLALVLAVVLYAVVALVQNLAIYLIEPESEVGREPQGGEVAKLFLLAARGLESLGGPSGMLGAAAASQFADDSMHPADQLQAVLILGESAGPDAALDWLYAIRSEMDLEELAGPGAAGHWQQKVAAAREENPEPADLDWASIELSGGPEIDEEAVSDGAAMEALYRDGPDALDADARSRLVERYGWLGELGLTYPLEKDSAERLALYERWPWAIFLLMVVGVVMTVGVVGGLTMFIVASVLMLQRKLRFRFVPPMPGGSVHMETFALFLGLFFGIQVLGEIVAGAAQGSPAVTVGVMIAQWLLLPLLLWPLLRGMTFSTWRAAVGWRAPRGVAREVGAGVLGYFAGLPLFFAGILLTFVLNVIADQLTEGAAPPPHNPVLELISTGNLLIIALFVLLATIWAPIMEETIFRGGLYRHLRGRSGVIVAALVTALLFAFLHSYGPLMTGPLIALGFTFAMLREWRGSLLAPMTAHFLHNATITTISLIGVMALS